MMNLKRNAAIAMSLLAFSVSAAFADNDLPNYQQINNFLARGGAPTTQGVRMLSDRHIGTVIDTRAANPASTDEQREVERLKMNYIRHAHRRRRPNGSTGVTIRAIRLRAPSLAKHGLDPRCVCSRRMRKKRCQLSRRHLARSPRALGLQTSDR